MRCLRLIRGVRRRRWLAVVVAAAVVPVGGCASSDLDDGVAVEVLRVRAQTCDRPNPRIGAAIQVADGLAITAAHVVEGHLRRLDIAGRTATVVAIDDRLDLALIAVASDENGGAQLFADDTPRPEAGDAVVIRTIADDVDATITRVLTLRIDDVTAGEVIDREALEFDVLVDGGDSGSPVLDARGNVVGIVVLRRRDASVSYATPLTTETVSELRTSASSTDTGASSLVATAACT